MHYHYRRHRFLHALYRLIAAVVVVYAVWTGCGFFIKPGFDAKKIVEESILKEKTFTQKPVEITSPSGIKAWLMEEHSVPIIALSFIFERGGYAYDPVGKAGRAGIAANMLVYGSGKHDRREFQEIMELNGVRIAFSAGREDLSAGMITPSENKDIAFALLQSALTSPHFDRRDLQVEKQQNLEALKIQQEHPASILSLAFAEELFGANHPYGRNPLGSKEDIASITSEDLQKWLKESLALDNLIVGIAGDITPEEASVALDKIFANLPTRNANREILAPDMNLKPHTKYLKQDTAQIVSDFAAEGTRRSAQDFYPLYIANHILGGSGLTSRLSLAAREKEGLTYGIYTYLSTDEKTPLILGQFSATPENYGKIKQIINAEWQSIARKGVRKKELEDARNYLLSSYNLRFNSIAGLADMLAAMQKYELGLDFLQKRNSYVKAVTLEEVNQAAAKYFSVLPMEVAIGDFDNPNEE